ncbi:DUF4238 domain-containing protein [Marinilabiliaceae bacterium JC017]|nr:DUF4238 domain-containing protein [Marinilabiliaceae bacterium JC017]
MAGPNQHFVPQYYLKTFSEEDRVFVFDKKENKYLSERRIPVDKIGFSKNFYDIEPEDLSRFLIDDTDDKSYVDSLIEKYNERISSPLIKSFIDLGEKVYKYKEMEIVSYIRTDDIIDFLVVQLFRTPFFRKQFEFTARDIRKKHSDKIELNEKYSVERLTQAIHGVYIISAICNTEIWKNSEKNHLIKPSFQFIDYEVIDKFEQLRKMSKTLWVSSLDSCFITSDNPIVIKQNDKGRIEMLFFPLTKRCTVTFWNEKAADKSVIIVNERRKHVLQEKNRIMKDWAYRFVYSYDKE